MKEYAPQYYRDFRCIADKCRHSCCVGWEIDVDDVTYAKYKAVDGDFGRRLTTSIREEGNIRSFCLTETERCPFLNESGLCDVILNLGESYLSQICTDHPRFRNFFSDRTEIGLGLSCEEAARLVLSQKEPMHLVVISDDGEEDETAAFDAALLIVRDELLSFVAQKNLSLNERLQSVLTAVSAIIPQKSMAEWADVYMELEMLDTSWGALLGRLATVDDEAIALLGTRFDKELSQLLSYFIYRHTSAAIDEIDLRGRVSFSVLGVLVVRALCAVKMRDDGACVFDDLAEFCRLYSSEIEYSEENVATLLDVLSE